MLMIHHFQNHFYNLQQFHMNHLDFVGYDYFQNNFLIIFHNSDFNHNHNKMSFDRYNLRAVI